MAESKKFKKPGYSGIIGVLLMFAAGLVRRGGPQFVESLGLQGDTAGNVYFLLLAISFAAGTILSIAAFFEGGDLNQMCGFFGVGILLLYCVLFMNAMSGGPVRR